ncbi:MAG: signal transduction histidine kinase/CheY-like chemotaxis protein [Halioglobus sp.]|jgi:signal transduction histidine kinase/CheY-like chemotaxis protein
MKNMFEPIMQPGKATVGKKLRRFIFFVCITTILIVTITSLYTSYLFERQSVTELLRSHALVMSKSNAAALVFNDVDSSIETLSSLDTVAGILSAVIYDSNNSEFSSFRRNAAVDNLEAVPGFANNWQFENNRSNRILFEKSTIHYQSTIYLEGEVIGSIYLRYNMDHVYQQLQDIVMINLGSGIFALAVMIILVRYFERIFTRPIKALHEGAHQVSAFDDYSVRVPRLSDDELGELTDVFNTMLTTVQSRDNELAARGLELEDRVLSRTRELELTTTMAEKANRAKSEFLATMSHEIRTPMNAVIGMTQLTLHTSLSPIQQNYLEKTETAAKQLLSIINDILDFSKIEAGELVVDKISFSLNDLLSNVSNVAGVKAQQKGLEFLIDSDHNLPTILIGDPLRLGQVLINLADNAVKFTAEGEIIISVRAMDKTTDNTLTENQFGLVFSVIDTGVGIEKNQQQGLFNPFTQADSSTTRQYGGTGLGLAICKQLVELMGGGISIASEIGVGSEFSFTTTVEVISNNNGKHQNEESDNVDPSLIGLPVLVVDDNVSALNISTRMMEIMRCEVTTAKNGEQVLEKIAEAEKRNNPIKLILIDWMMPKMNGLQIIKHLRSQHLIPESTAIILTSGYQRNEILTEKDQHLISGFISKPVTYSTLLEVVTESQTTLDKQPAPLPLGHVHDSESLIVLHGARVLLVEDNLANQEVASDILGNAHVTVDIANNGKQAIDMLKAGHYDGVLMDVQMPVMDGLETTKELRSILGFQTIPIIAMTANAMVGDREKCLDSGMSDYISKPLDIDILYDTLAKWLKKK